MIKFCSCWDSRDRNWHTRGSFPQGMRHTTCPPVCRTHALPSRQCLWHGTDKACKAISIPGARQAAQADTALAGPGQHAGERPVSLLGGQDGCSAPLYIPQYTLKESDFLPILDETNQNGSSPFKCWAYSALQVPILTQLTRSTAGSSGEDWGLTWANLSSTTFPAG